MPTQAQRQLSKAVNKLVVERVEREFAEAEERGGLAVCGDKRKHDERHLATSRESNLCIKHKGALGFGFRRKGRSP